MGAITITIAGICMIGAFACMVLQYRYRRNSQRFIQLGMVGLTALAIGFICILVSMILV